MESCNVCCSLFTEKVRHEIVCIHCKGSFCQKCLCTYLLTEGTKQVCMLCLEEINTEFIYLHTPKAFREKYFIKETENIMKEETLLLTVTKEKLYMEKRAKLLSSRIRALESHIKKFSTDTEIVTLLQKSQEDLQECRSVINLPEKDLSSKSKVVVCSVTSCDGIAIKGICNQCQTQTCPECQMAVTDPTGHVCDPTILETIKFLKKDTKPCPKCSVPIHKIEGCDQMFCILCQTAFSWRTGRVESGVIHNPHYFQWLRQKGEEIPRQPGDDPCGRAVDVAVVAIGKSGFKDRNEFCKQIIDRYFIEKILRELNTVITRLSTAIYDVRGIENKKRDLRIKYIKNKNYKNWFVAIKTLIKRHEMNKDCLYLLQTFERGFKDALVKANLQRKDGDELEQSIKSLDQYFAEQIKEIKKRHGISPLMEIVIPNGLTSKWLNHYRN